jgi:putative nucleotidyltransferase-like protein/BON domain-containing protein
VTDQEPFEPVHVEEEVFLDVLREVHTAFEEHGIPALIVGGIASTVFGRDRWTHDIDFLVRRQDRWRALQVLEAAGYHTQETYPDWLFKGMKNGVLVDVLFCSSGQALDDEMLARARMKEFKGLCLRLVSPEDLLIMKVLALKEDTPRYWYDALGLIASCELDWGYLLHRAQGRGHRVLSLLVFAQGEGLPIPDGVIRQFVDHLCAPVAHDEYLVGKLQEALAQDPRTGELGLNATAEEGTVVLSGTVATLDRREAVLTVAREIAGDRPIQANLSVPELSTPDEMEDLGDPHGVSAPIEGEARA